MINRFYRGICAVVAAFSLAACDDGRLSLAVTDAPVDDAERVELEFTGVVLESGFGNTVEFFFCENGPDDRPVVSENPCTSPRPLRIDLLALEGGERETLLDDVQVESGNYNAIRLKINAQQALADSIIALNDGSEHSLFIPDDAREDLRLASDFSVPVLGAARLTLDIDLRRSVLRPETVGDDFILRPALRLVDDDNAGRITGEVDFDLIRDEACDAGMAVYVFEGTDVEPLDVRRTGSDPISSARVLMDDDGRFPYEVALLPAGEYTAALTCEADQDEPDAEDEIAFIQSVNVSVTAGEATVQDFR